MTTLELRNKLIKKIKQVEDEEILNEIYRLLEESAVKSELIELSENHKKAIDEALQQIEHGETMTNEMANLEIRQWLNR